MFLGVPHAVPALLLITAARSFQAVSFNMSRARHRWAGCPGHRDKEQRHGMVWEEASCVPWSAFQTWKCSSSTSSKNHSASGGNRHPGTVQAGQAALDLRSTLRNPKVHTFQILASSPLFWEMNLTTKHSPWLLYLLLPHLLEQRCTEDPFCPTPWQTPPSPSGVTSAEWESSCWETGGKEINSDVKNTENCLSIFLNKCMKHHHLWVSQRPRQVHVSRNSSQCTIANSGTKV